MKFNDNEERRLIALYKQGLKTKDIALGFGVSQSKVTAKIYQLQREGIIDKRYGKKTNLPVDKPIRMRDLNYIPKKAALPMTQQPTVKDSKMLGKNQVKIAELVDEIKVMLLAKNAQYGDSALQPVRVFSKADTTEQIKVRIDDKINRIVQGNDSMESDEDVIKDLIGYLVLLLINMRE